MLNAVQGDKGGQLAALSFLFKKIEEYRDCRSGR